MGRHHCKTAKCLSALHTSVLQHVLADALPIWPVAHRSEMGSKPSPPLSPGHTAFATQHQSQLSNRDRHHRAKGTEPRAGGASGRLRHAPRRLVPTDPRLHGGGGWGGSQRCLRDRGGGCRKYGLCSEDRRFLKILPGSSSSMLGTKFTHDARGDSLGRQCRATGIDSNANQQYH